MRGVSNRARFGIDVDGVMYHFQKTYCYMMNTMKGYSLDYEKWAYWNWPEDNGVTKHDKQWMWSKGVELGLFRYGHLYKGTIEAMRALNKLGDIVIITHRPRNAVQDTIDWLSYNRLPVMEVHLLTEGQPKSNVAACDLYLDDKPENIEDFVQHYPRALSLLWRRPWNVMWDDTRVARVVNTWQEVIDHAQGVVAGKILENGRGI